MKRNQMAEYRSYESCFTGVTGKSLPVRPVPEHEDALGYTAAKAGIFVAFAHPIMNMLKEKAQRFFRSGVFVHEMLHQIFTNLKYHERKLKQIENPYERQIAATIINVVEDPAIEYWAPTVIGGLWLKALRFTIAHIYKNSPKIEASKSKYSQYLSALIQFGDMGLVKGVFTFPETKECFMKTAPIFDAAIKEPSSSKRIDMALEIFELSRPLWQEIVEENEKMEELLKELMELGKSPMSGSGSGSDGDESKLPSEESKKEKRRKITIKKVTKEEMDEMGKNSGSASGKLPDEGDVTVYVCDEEDDKNKDSDGSDEGISIPGESEGDNDESSRPEESESPDTPSGKPYISADIDEDIDDDCTIDNDEYEISDEDMKAIEKAIERADKDFEDAEGKEEADNSSLLDYDAGSSKMSSRTCLNHRIEGGEDELVFAYQKIVAKYLPSIKSVSTQLKRVFLNDTEEKQYKSSGRANLQRMYGAKKTSRVFTRKKDPSDVEDFVMMLVVDESGSMSGAREKAAMESAIALSEICANLKVPLYVMGFTADTEGYGVVHNHYITWKNSLKERIKLLNIRARSNNCDGYSIRYATEIMRRKKANHKLMVVLSDGRPAACSYSNGVSDTKDAIRDAKRVTSVLGIAIGNSDTDLIYSMYGADFLHVSSTDDLFVGIVKKIKKIVTGWN